jgi:hypothetical protein
VNRLASYSCELHFDVQLRIVEHFFDRSAEKAVQICAVIGGSSLNSRLCCRR